MTAPAAPGPKVAAAGRRPTPMPDDLRERALLAEGFRTVAGLDEVGRGAWAGPVSVGAAVFAADCPAPDGLRDSKLVPEPRREELFPLVASWCVAWAVGHASPEECDRWGMTIALRLAARRALAGLPCRPDAVLLDGSFDYLSDRRPSPGAPVDEEEGGELDPGAALVLGGTVELPVAALVLDAGGGSSIGTGLAAGLAAGPGTGHAGAGQDGAVAGVTGVTGVEVGAGEATADAGTVAGEVGAGEVAAEGAATEADGAGGPPLLVGRRADPLAGADLAAALAAAGGGRPGEPWSGPEVRTVVRGDACCVSIAAASIVAKVTRDRIMRELSADFPGFDFHQNKGYPSPVHRAALAGGGLTSIHRRSWSFATDLTVP